MALLPKLAGAVADSDDNDVSSIRENINNILTTRRDYGFFVPSFGLSDHHHLNSSPEISALLISEIKKTIEQFEPRVEVIEVISLQNNPFDRLSFAIDCRVRDGGYRLKLFLHPNCGCYEVNE